MLMKIDVVIARYKEDLSWIEYLKYSNYKNMTLYVYNKCGTEDAYVSSVDWAKVVQTHLPNLGRESHTYLHHILEHYDERDKITIFLQGNLSDHYSFYGFSDELHMIESMIEDCVTTSTCSEKFARIYDFGEYSAHWDFKVSSHNGQTLDISPFKYGEWFENYIGKYPGVDNLKWWIAACFCCSSSTIRKRDIKDYQLLINRLSSPNPEEGHFMERSWYQFFQNEGIRV
jgi:hypothetical protein